MQAVPQQRAMHCPRCALQHYPRLSPSMIVLISRGDEILLARSERFPPGMYSTLAGFVEPGESVEQCVHREVFEEVGLRIRDLQYVGSQGWPFPRSLMLSAYENSLVDTPYPVEHQMVVVEAIEKLTYGTALFAAAAETYHLPAMPAFDADRYPRLATALQAGPQDQLAMFEESLRALLDGFKARYSAQ